MRRHSFIVVRERSQSGTMLLGCIGDYIYDWAAIAKVSQLVDGEERGAGKVGLHSQNAIELDGMSDGFVDLQAKLRGAEDYGELSFRTLRRLVQGDRFLADPFGILY